MQAGSLTIALFGMGLGFILSIFGLATGVVGATGFGALIYLTVEFVVYSLAAIAAVLSRYLPRRKSLLLTLGALLLIWWTISANFAGSVDLGPIIPCSAYLIAVFYPSSSNQ